MKIKKFKCLMCNDYVGTRKGLREHLKQEHSILKSITNFPSVDGGSVARRQFNPNDNTKQQWWGTE